MIKAELDRQRHERNLKAFSKAFGDSSQQAVIRWGVQVGREFAVSTQPFGSGKASKEKGRGAMYRDALNVILTVDEKPKGGNRVLSSADEINSWIEQNRNGKGRTKQLGNQQKKIVHLPLFEKTMKARVKKSGTAKDGWLDAGTDLARHQQGAERIAIGKRFIGWAQKPAVHGNATKPKSGFSPVAVLQNLTSHSGWNLAATSERKAVIWALRKTITFYRRTLKARERKANAK
jgi:hypothetical protein